MKIQKVSQIDLVKYIDELDEKLNNERVREILYGEYLKNTGKNTRKTKTDKRYVVIAALTRDNFRTKIGDTTVWRVLKVKKKSKELFEQMQAGNMSIKEAYYKAYPQNDESNSMPNEHASKSANDSVITSDTISEAIESDTGNTPQSNDENDNGWIPDFASDDDILGVIKEIHQELQQNNSNHLNNRKLREIDGELFALRKMIVRLMGENEED